MQEKKIIFQNSALTKSRGKEEPVSLSARVRYFMSRMSSDENSNDLIEAAESEGYSSRLPSPDVQNLNTNQILRIRSTSSSITLHGTDDSNNNSMVFDDYAMRFFNGNVCSKPRASAVLDEKHILINAEYLIFKIYWHML